MLCQKQNIKAQLTLKCSLLCAVSGSPISCGGSHTIPLILQYHTYAANGALISLQRDIEVTSYNYLDPCTIISYYILSYTTISYNSFGS